MKWLKDNYITLIVLVVIITIILQLKRIGNLFTDLFKSDFKKKDDSKSTLTDVHAESYAERLYQSLRYPFDYEDVVYDVFKNIKTLDDYHKVYNAFDFRYKWFIKRDLTYWLNADLNEEEKRYINDNFVKIF